MNRNTKLLTIDLSVHDDAGGGTVAPPNPPAAGIQGVSASGAPGRERAAAQAGAKQGPGSSRRAKTGDAAPGVLYGKQPQADVQRDPKAGGDSLTAKRAEFERLVSGEYKDVFTERTQQLINRRFAETRNLEERLQSLSPLLDTLSKRYGVQDGDPGRLAQAFEADGRFFEELAREQGLTVEQYKAQQGLLRESEQLRKARQEQMAHGQYARWLQEAEEVKKTYPSFDLRREASSSQFAAMLRSGVPLRAAYEAMHLDEIKTGVARQVGRRTEQNLTSTIRAKGARPPEAGASAPSGVLVKNDVSQLSRTDRAEIARRVARGEKIMF